jgi:hypothetical protein
MSDVAAMLARRPAWTLSILWLLMTLPWTSGLKAIPFDSLQQFYPALAFEVQQLRQLQGPWWNPLLFGGYPQFADPQMMTFQPSMVLPLLLAPGTSVVWFDSVVLLNMLAGGLGCLHLARHYGLRNAAGLLVALTFMFGGVAASRLQHTPMIVSYALLPWAWLGMRSLAAQPGLRKALLLALPLALCALQLTQLTYLIALAVCAYGVALIVRQAPGTRMRLIGWFAATAVVALLVSAVQWLPTLAWLGQTNRLVQSLDAAAAGSTSLPALSTVLAGNLLSHSRGSYWGGGDISQDYAYVGAVPLALWLLWGGAVVRRFPLQSRVMLAVIMLSSFYALGVHAPLYRLLHAALPGVDLFRRPADALFLGVPCMAMLAGFSLQVRLEGRRLSPHWPSIVALGALLLYALSLAATHRHLGAAAVGLATTGAIGAFAGWRLRGVQTPSRNVLAGLLALVVLDLMVHNVARRFNAVSLRSRALTSQVDSPPVGGGQEALNLMLQRLPRTGIPERAEVYGLATLNNGAMVHGIALLAGYNPILDTRYASFLGVQGLPPATPAQRIDTPWVKGERSAALDLAGLRLLVSDTPFDGAQRQGALYLRQRGSVLPRMLAPVTVRRHAGEFPEPQAYAATDFATTLWLPEAASTGACGVRATMAQDLKVEDYAANAIVVSYRAAGPAWIVVNERMAPGWQAAVGGRPVALLRANGLFRAVCVPAGRHTLRLSYAPLRMVREGLALRGTRPRDTDQR